MIRRHGVEASAYFSHSIRGAKGDKATKADMEYNCQVAEMAADMLRANWPKLDLYVPAEHEDFVQRAFDHKYTPEKEILEIDCEILEQRDMLVAFSYRGVISKGMDIEIRHADSLHIPVFIYEDVDETLHLIKRILDWHYDKTIK
jgi:hypothetical protein